MRTNQASQSVVLAFVLVATLGFLAHTMLGSSTPVAHPTSAPEDAPKLTRKEALSAGGAQTQTSGPASAVRADSPIAGMKAQDLIPAAPPSSSGLAPNAATPDAAPVMTAEPGVSAKAAVAPVVLPPPVPEPKTASRGRHPMRRAEMRSGTVKPVVTAAAVPKTFSPATPAVVSAEVPSQKDPTPVAAAPAKRTPVVTGGSQPFSKEEMTVTISGEQAWVQVSPTKTVTARKGDVLPNLGKILEIRKNEVVAEQGTLVTN